MMRSSSQDGRAGSPQGVAGGMSVLAACDEPGSVEEVGPAGRRYRQGESRILCAGARTARLRSADARGRRASARFRHRHSAPDTHGSDVKAGDPRALSQFEFSGRSGCECCSKVLAMRSHMDAACSMVWRAS